MADPADKGAKNRDELDAAIAEARIACVKSIVAFQAFDGQANAAVLKLLQFVVERVEARDPSIFEAGRTDVAELLARLGRGSSEPGIEGGDVVGGTSGWVADIVDLVRGIGDFLASEKEFFEGLIEKFL